MIFFEDASVSAELKRLGFSDGKWFVAEHGGMKKVNDEKSFKSAFKKVLEGKNFFHYKQEITSKSNLGVA